MIGRGRADHVVGGHPGEVEDQPLVDLGLHVQDVAQLVDPVVQVHESQPRPVGRCAATPGPLPFSELAQVRPRVHVARLGALPGHLGEVEPGHQPVQGQAVLAVAGRAGGVQRGDVEHGGELAAPVGAHEERAVASPGRGAQPREGRGGDAGHVHGEHAQRRDRLGQGVPAGQQARGRPAVRRALAGERDGPPGRHLGRRPRPPGPRRPARRGRARAGGDRRTRARPCRPRRAARRCRRRARRPRTRRRGGGPCGQSGSRTVRRTWHAGAVSTVRLALVQEASGLDPAANRDRLAALTPDDTDLVVLPEAFARDFGAAGSDVSGYAEGLDGPFATELARVAAERGTTVVAGMFETGPSPESGLLERVSALFALKSPLSARYSKRDFRADTRAISDITKRPFTNIRTSNMSTSIEQNNWLLIEGRESEALIKTVAISRP